MYTKHFRAPSNFGYDTTRCISRDPLDNAEMKQGPNLYEYVRDNPVNAVDPLGDQTGVPPGPGDGFSWAVGKVVDIFSKKVSGTERADAWNNAKAQCSKAGRPSGCSCCIITLVETVIFGDIIAANRRSIWSGSGQYVRQKCSDAQKAELPSGLTPLGGHIKTRVPQGF